MRVLEFSTGDTANHVGVVADTAEGPGVVDLTVRLPTSARSLGHLLQQPGWRQLVDEAVQGTEPDVSLDAVTYEPLLANSGRVFAAGLNYAKKYPVGTEQPPTPKFPPWFSKMPGTLVGHDQPVVAPSVSESFDYEAELAAVIGVGGRHIPVADALDHVAGWTCLNDGSVRHWQRHSVNAGKNFEQSGSVGPWMVTADDIADPQNLQLSARVDGELRQNANTGEMIFTVAEIINYLSQILELRPGDVIATGSPEGTGGSFDPPKFLTVGQTVEIEVAGIGVLRNNVIAEES
jgi:2-keto-4-pentenoate hydratase/2-oxohepta-3-ene-1,7-dioic acid hydratase in catechol pathway